MNQDLKPSQHADVAVPAPGSGLGRTAGEQKEAERRTRS